MINQFTNHRIKVSKVKSPTKKFTNHQIRGITVAENAKNVENAEKLKNTVILTFLKFFPITHEHIFRAYDLKNREVLRFNISQSHSPI